MNMVYILSTNYFTFLLIFMQNSGTMNLIDSDGCNFAPNTGANKLS